LAKFLLRSKQIIINKIKNQQKESGNNKNSINLKLIRRIMKK